MKKNRVLFLCQYFYPEHVSSGVLPTELAEHLATKDYRVSALVGYPKEYTNEKEISINENYKNIQIKRVKYLQSKRSGFVGRIINYLGLCLSIVLRPLYFFKNDTYICYTNPPLLPFIASMYAKLFNKNLIIVLYDLYPDVAIKLDVISKGSILDKVFTKITDFSFKCARKVVVLSTEMKEYLKQYRSVDGSKIEVIPNWYKEQEYQCRNIEQPINVFYGGNMGKAQELDTLLDVMLKYKNDERVYFEFIGHGVKQKEVEDFIKDNEISNASLTSFLPKEEYDRRLVNADLCVVSLDKNVYGLGCPSKTYGYLALGKPIAAIMSENTDIVKDIKEYHNGVYVEQGNANGLYEEIEKILKNPSVLKEMGTQSKNLFMGKYTLEVNVKKYEQLLK